MAIPHYRVLFDTSVYITAVLSPKGAAAELIRLAEARAITMVVSEQVIIESDKALSKKFPDLAVESRRLCKNIGPGIAKGPSRKTLKQFQQHLPAADAAILSAAQGTSLNAFVTWNTRDFR